LKSEKDKFRDYHLRGLLFKVDPKKFPPEKIESFGIKVIAEEEMDI